MTPQELNRDIKRLAKRLSEINGTEQYFDIVQNEIKPEFKRLYRADLEMKYINKQSVLILLRINLLLRIEPLHTFGIYVEI